MGEQVGGSEFVLVEAATGPMSHFRDSGTLASKPKCISYLIGSRQACAIGKRRAPRNSGLSADQESPGDLHHRFLPRRHGLDGLQIPTQRKSFKTCWYADTSGEMHKQDKFALNGPCHSASHIIPFLDRFTLPNPTSTRATEGHGHSGPGRGRYIVFRTSEHSRSRTAHALTRADNDRLANRNKQTICRRTLMQRRGKVACDM
ncbi:hypothetical protein J6590_053882 [Homalodisca vitripennis]|nr:hypothetical protein J6590_053882 [Homalodisca vitripennis]